jgi:iron(III) transport system substrate-binding protein
MLRSLAAILAVAMASCAPASSPAAAPASPAAPAPAAAAPASQAAPTTDAAWQAEWNRTVAAAKQEGKLALMGSGGTLIRDALMEFQKAYPEINVEYAAPPPGDIAVKVPPERDAGQFLWDVHIGHPGPAYDVLLPRGVMDPLAPALVLPEVLDDSKWLGGFKAGFMDKDGQYAYAFQGSLGYIAWVNRDVIPEAELSRFDQLTDPKWAGRIVWYDPTTRSAGGAMAGYLYMVFGEDYLRKVFAQDVTITRDVRQQVEWLVRGRYPIALGIENDRLVEFQNQGLGRNVKPLEPESQVGARMNIGLGAVLLFNQPPHPNAAKVFANWLLSPDGQTAWGRHALECSRRLDVTECPSEKRLNPGKQYLDIDHEVVRHFQTEATSIAGEVFK